MKLLVVIVTYNAMQWVERCFNSLRKSTIVPDVFVVDNGSTDGTQAYIQEHYPEVMFHQSDENLGFGKANNLGLQYALDHKYDYVYLLNQDAWIFPETLERLIEISKKHPEYGILSPFQMEANLKHLDLNFKKHVCSWKSSPNLLDYLYLGSDCEVYPVKGVMAAHWLITRDCLQKVGGFSPTFPHYGEDDNYYQRAFYYGFNVGIVPSLKVVHDRENRELSVSQRLYFCNIKLLKSLSNPVINNRFSRAVYIILSSMIKFKSFKPLGYLYDVIVQYQTIKKNRLVSISTDCAFLISNRTVPNPQ